MNVLELEAALLAVLHMADLPQATRHRVPLFVDSTVAIGHFRKVYPLHFHSTLYISESPLSYSSTTLSSCHIRHLQRSTIPTPHLEMLLAGDIIEVSTFEGAAISLNYLHSVDVKGPTLKVYKKATLDFLSWLRKGGVPHLSVLQFYTAMADYSWGLFDNNPKRGRLNHFRYALYGLEFCTHILSRSCVSFDTPPVGGTRSFSLSLRLRYLKLFSRLVLLVCFINVMRTAHRFWISGSMATYSQALFASSGYMTFVFLGTCICQILQVLIGPGV